MKNEQWVVLTKHADFRAIASKFHVDPVIARILRNRGLTDDDGIRSFLETDPGDLYDPMSLKDMDKAVTLLKNEIAGGARIRVIGDYDIDGVMASYILKCGLTRLGADCDVRIPDRITDGYGVSLRMIEEAAADGAEVIVTCDNGTAASREVARAKELGMRVVVTDHHEVIDIPEADAVVNPHRPDCPYPNKDLCGAGAAYKLIEALYKANGISPEEALAFLPYAAFATVGDIMDLTGENRVIVKEGIRRLRQTDNTGLLALCSACGIRAEMIDTYHIGYVLGPCINAGGRLDSALRPLRLLLSEDPEEAMLIASELKDLNDTRKALTEQGVEAARQLLADPEQVGDKVFLVFLPQLHESVAGIVAGRIREETGHPVYVLTRSGDRVKGSGRSVPAYPMFSELRMCGDLLERFGGHPMAAGLSLQEKNIPELRRRLNENCPLTEESFAEKVTIDMQLTPGYITEPLVRQIESLAPFGKGNPRPLFAERNLTVRSPRLLGTKQNVLRMTLCAEDGSRVNAICFRNAQQLFDRVEEDPKIAAVYYPQINEYGGICTVQAVIEHWR